MMFYRSFFPRDVFSQLDRLHSQLSHAFEGSPNIRGAEGGFPAINLGTTERSVEIHAFAPGIDPASLDVQIDKGVLTLSGERKTEERAEQTTIHVDERFSGEFRRVIALPDDIDATAVSARYSDGVLQISVPRREAAQPRRITIQ
ncbi:Hsp20 family protein [Niveibacterium sp. SC-1]|uniref:Hsp20/alpha crystallin family protein n=1 Tax=Niveibacterium sp. SC-1 TaxID=3135646 RepID=UPI00311FE1D6